MAIRRRAEVRLRDERLAGQIGCKPLARRSGRSRSVEPRSRIGSNTIGSTAAKVIARMHEGDVRAGGPADGKRRARTSLLLRARPSGTHVTHPAAKSRSPSVAL